MSKKICYFFLFFISSQSLFASITDISYYPESLIHLKESLHKDQHDSSQAQDFIRELRETLSKTHLQVDGLRDSLHENCPIERPAKSRCIEQRRDITYKQARTYLFGQLHLEQQSNSYFVEDQYCQNLISERDGVGPERIPNSSIINCEHTWPQSRFNPRYSLALQKTDLHHLFPVDSRANSSRGNIPFGEVENNSTSLCAASKRGLTVQGNTAFEPPDQHKGNVARAIFYFSVRYGISISSEEESFLRSWHVIDPVDDDERARNENIYSIQGNRNPFIDESGLVELVLDF